MRGNRLTCTAPFEPTDGGPGKPICFRSREFPASGDSSPCNDGLGLTAGLRVRSFCERPRCGESEEVESSMRWWAVSGSPAAHQSSRADPSTSRLPYGGPAAASPRAQRCASPRRARAGTGYPCPCRMPCPSRSRRGGAATHLAAQRGARRRRGGRVPQTRCPRCWRPCWMRGVPW